MGVVLSLILLLLNYKVNIYFKRCTYWRYANPKGCPLRVYLLSAVILSYLWHAVDSCCGLMFALACCGRMFAFLQDIFETRDVDMVITTGTCHSF